MKTLHDLKKGLKHCENLVNPLQSQVGRLEDHLARSQLRLAKLEAAAAPESADGGTVADNFDVLDQVSNILSTNVEPLSTRLHALETFLMPLPRRIGELEEKTFFDETMAALEGKEKNAKISGTELIQARMSCMENLLGPLHERLLNMEESTTRSIDTVQSAKKAIKKTHHHAAQLESLTEKLKSLAQEHATTRQAACKLEQKVRKLKGTKGAPESEGALATVTEEGEKAAEGEAAPEGSTFLTGTEECEDGEACEEDSEVLLPDLNAEAHECLSRKMEELEQQVHSQYDELLKELDTRVEMIQQQSMGDGVSVITAESIVKVKAERTHNGYDWAISQWNGVIERLCDVHNAPWEALSQQLGIYDTLMVFRNLNFEDDTGDLETTRLETQFIDHLESALRTKADSASMKQIEVSLKQVQKDLLKMRDRMESQSVDAKVLDHIEDRVAEMIRAAAPVESDIVDRLQLLFENKMVNREELEGMLEDRLKEMEEAIGSKGRNLTSQGGRASRAGKRGGAEDNSQQVAEEERVNRSRQREKIAGSVKDMQLLSSKADRKELLNAIESVEKQVPGAQDRLATALAARAHCYQTLRCLSCDEHAKPPGSSSNTGAIPSPLVPKGSKRTERMVNIRSLLDQQERAASNVPRSRVPTAGNSKSTVFLHLMPRTGSPQGAGIVGVNTPRGATTLHSRSASAIDALPMPEMRGNSPSVMQDQLVDMNMSLGLHVRSLPQISPDKQWSPEVAREMRKGFNI